MDSEDVAQFTSITGASAQTAEHYLEQAGGDVQEAIEQYYAAGGQEVPAAGGAASAAAAAAGGQSARPSGGGRRVPSGGNIRGFGDLGGEEESEEEEDEDNEYYAGGAKSGVAVRGGPKEGRDRVADLFEEARRRGAEEGRGEDLHDADGARFRAFSGGARTLAGGVVGGEPAQQAQRAQPSERRVTVTFYRNGVFTVDDGEPREVQDPTNLPFMRAIMEHRVPPELQSEDPSVEVLCNLVRRDEDYAPPAKPKAVAFAGTGRRLGGDAGASTSAAAAAAAAEPPATSGAPMVTWEGADESQPTTSIQLRLMDSSRMVAKFNLTHTVADIRRFIHASRPDMPTSYRLLTAFPSAQLDDDSATIQAAGLQNSVIIQK